MKTIEQIFLESKVIFEQQASQAVREAVSNLYTEYLPHVENDTASNVYFRSTEWIRRYLAGELREDDFKIDILAKDVRDKIWNEHKNELIPLFEDDLSKRFAQLEQEYGREWEHKYWEGIYHDNI